MALAALPLAVLSPVVLAPVLPAVEAATPALCSLDFQGHLIVAGTDFGPAQTRWNESFVGTNGDDVVLVSASIPGVSVDGWGGNDVICLDGTAAYASGGAGNDLLAASGAVATQLYGDEGADRLWPGVGGGYLYGGGVTPDQVGDFFYAPPTLTGPLYLVANDAAATGASNVLDLSRAGRGVAMSRNTAHPDYDRQVTGLGSPIYLRTSVGTVRGTGFADTLYARVDYSDSIDGRAGDDVVTGGGGMTRTAQSRLVGGAGRDTLRFLHPVRLVLTNGSSGEAAVGPRGRDLVSGFEKLVGSPGADTIVGHGAADAIDGGGGADLLKGGGGADVVLGGPGDDRVYGGSGHDRLRGGSGKDRLVGGSGKDRLSGDAGKDRLDGGAARDRCVGGSGKDSAVRCEVRRRI